MSLLDKNKIFFGLLHYIFSEQKNVDWALKTSLVNYTGINSTVNNKKYKQDSVIEDVIDYIYQIKPYHVEFEQFIEKYSSQRDDVNVSGTKEQEKNNITMYIRYDAVTSAVDPQGSLSDIEYMDTHMANRLYAYKTKNLDDIKDYLNCHFKGITINGSTFNVDTAGYDAFLYDSTLYDAPTVTNDYCLVNYNENFDYPYIKEFVNVGLQTFKLENEDLLQHNFITITSYFNGIETEITDYSLENNLLTLFYTIRNLEKLVITEDKDGQKKSWVFVGHPFNKMSSDTGLKEFKEYGIEYFDVPEGGFNSNKITVNIEYPNGTRDISEQITRVPLTNWELVDGKVYLPFDKENNQYYDNRIVENGHIIVTTIDYYYIYDKIYTWEDRYGQSNNVINVDGSGFLRPSYEVERPSELCVSAPLPYLMIYNVDDNNVPTSLYGCDYKDYQYKMNFSKSKITQLTKDLNIGDSEIYVKNINALKLPIIEKNKDITPGKIIINSEIIEFYEVDEANNILKRIRRGADGSYLAEKHNINDYVIDFRESTQKDCSSRVKSIMTFITDDVENKFIIPGTLTDNEKVNVMIKPLINLLTPIKYNSTYFDISSDNIYKPGNVSLTIPTNNLVIHSNQNLNVIIGNKTYIVKITKNITGIDEFITYMKQSTSGISNFNIIKDNNNIVMIANQGKSIVLSNNVGSPLQELTGTYVQGTKAYTTTDTPILKDGSNGLRINKNNVVWGSDKNSTGYMKEHPERGTLQDAVDTINNLSATKNIVKAYIYDNKLVIMPLQNIDITISNLTSPTSNEDNIEILGLPTVTNKNEIYDGNKIEIKSSKPSFMGYIFINDEKLYFENIQEVNSSRYRITNFYIDKEYTTDSVIYSENPILLTKDDYKIVTEEVAYSLDESTLEKAAKQEMNYVILNNQPANGEIITVSNDK